MADIGQDDVLGSGDLCRDRDELKDKYKALKQENFEVEKELSSCSQRSSLLIIFRKR